MPYLLINGMLVNLTPAVTTSARQAEGNLRCLAVLAACVAYLRHLDLIGPFNPGAANPAIDRLTSEMAIGVVTASRADGDQLLADVLALAQQLGLNPEAIALTSKEVN